MSKFKNYVNKLNFKTKSNRSQQKAISVQPRIFHFWLIIKYSGSSTKCQRDIQFKKKEGLKRFAQSSIVGQGYLSTLLSNTVSIKMDLRRILLPYIFFLYFSGNSET